MTHTWPVHLITWHVYEINLTTNPVWTIPKQKQNLWLQYRLTSHKKRKRIKHTKVVSSLRQIPKPGYGLAARSHTFSSATTTGSAQGAPVSFHCVYNFFLIYFFSFSSSVLFFCFYKILPEFSLFFLVRCFGCYVLFLFYTHESFCCTWASAFIPFFLCTEFVLVRFHCDDVQLDKIIT